MMMITRTIRIMMMMMVVVVTHGVGSLLTDVSRPEMKNNSSSAPRAPAPIPTPMPTSLPMPLRYCFDMGP